MTDANVVIGLLVPGLLFVAVGLLVIAIARAIANRLPRSTVAEYVPPSGDLFEHGLLVRADRRILAAVLIDLAVRGDIRVLAPRGARGPVAIEARPGASMSPTERSLLRALRIDPMRPRHERRYLRALRDIGLPVARLEDAPDVYFLRGRGTFRNHRRRELGRLLESTRERMKTEGLAKRHTVRIHLTLLSLLFLAALVVGLFLALGAIMNGEWVGALAVLVDVAAVFWILTLAPPPLLRFTERGRELRCHLSGLRDYIRLGEQRRLQVLQSSEGALRTPAGALTPGGRALGLAPKPTAGDPVAQSSLDRYVLIERLLPYAILFGQERSWQRELEHLGVTDASENIGVLGSTLEGVMAMLEVIAIILQVIRVIGSIFSLLGRLAH